MIQPYARTVVIREHGGPENLIVDNRTLADPGPGEVRVRHRACGLNFIDVYQRAGLYPLTLPAALGMEAAGMIEAVGADVTHVRTGDRVAYAATPPGAYCDARVMPAHQVCPLPDEISFEEGAAMMLKGLTVQYLFERTTPLSKGDTVLFHAAAGGVGLIACQWARAKGITLIATAGTNEKCQMALDHGAAHAINYREQDFTSRVMSLTNNTGVDVVMDSVGRETFEGSLNCLKPLGMMISFGNASGPVPPFELGQLAARGSLKVTRPTLFTHIGDYETCQAMARDLFEMVTSGAVKIRIGQTFPLDQIAEAHRALESRDTVGSTVLII